MSDATDPADAPDAGDVLDDLDRSLLRLLQEDARRSHRELARLAGSTQPTVGARLKRMEDAGVIRGYTVVLDAGAFGGGGEAEEADLDAPAAVACHWCKRRTHGPIWATVDGRRHPFCCTTCKGAYTARHDELARGA